MKRSLSLALKKTTGVDRNCCAVSFNLWNTIACDSLPQHLCMPRRQNSTQSSSLKPGEKIEHSWSDWFSQGDISGKVLYENPWDSLSTRLTPLPSTVPPAVDMSSRFSIQLLQELHHNGAPLSADRITTTRCNSTFAALAQVTPPDAAISDRAHAILENMLVFQQDKRYSQSTQLRRTMEWPVPNRDSFHWVLEIDSKTPGPASLPRRTEALVRTMDSLSQERGLVDLRTLPMHWNQVLLAWQKCLDWEKPVHAAKLLLDLRRDSPEMLSELSYIVVLSLCGQLAKTDREKQLGSGVAVRLWQEIFERDGEPNEEVFISHIFAMFLQAFRFLKDSTSKEIAHRSEYFEKCLVMAIQQGKVNEVILKEFLIHSRSKELFKKYFGQYSRRIRGLSPTEAVTVLCNLVPESWVAQADPLAVTKPEKLPRKGG